MTRINFYHHVSDKPRFLARLLADKLLPAQQKITFLLPDKASCDWFDQWLWRYPATGFLPHCHFHDPHAANTPIILTTSLEAFSHTDVLIQWCPMPPTTFTRFNTVVEVLGTHDDAQTTHAARTRWQFYREHGFALTPYNLQHLQFSAE